MKTKRCSRKTHVGNRELPITEFHKNSRSADGLLSMCKVCASKKYKEDRERIKTNPARKKVFLDSRKRERERGGKVRQLFYAASERAFKKGLEFNIEMSDIVIPDVCPVLGIEIRASKGRKGDDTTSGPGNRDSSPSIDRIDNSKGYIKGNIRVISWRANYLKNTATLDEMILLGEDAKTQKQIFEETK